MSAEEAVGAVEAAPPPCPVCGSSVVAPVGYGFPGPSMWEAALAGRLALGGCVVGQQEEWNEEWHCWPCADQRWIAEHRAREHRAGRTLQDCADDGRLWERDDDASAIRNGTAQDLERRFRPPGFVDRLRPYLRDVADGGAAWRPNAERIGAHLDATDARGLDGRHRTPTDPDRLTDEDLERVGLLAMVAGGGPLGERARSTVDWLREREERIVGLLRAIPADLELHTLDVVDYERTVGKSSPASRLRGFLEIEMRWTASLPERIAAHKRPALLVARHALVDAALGVPDDRQLWRPWWRTLTADPWLVERLEQLRGEVDAPDLPLLRIAWLSVLTREEDARAAGGPSPSEGLPPVRWYVCPKDERGLLGSTVPAASDGPSADGADEEDGEDGDDEWDGEELDPGLEPDQSVTPFWGWVENDAPIELLPTKDRLRAAAWLRASPYVTLAGDPDAPFHPGGTPRGVFHANLLRCAGTARDGLPGWRSPASRLHAHLFARDGVLHPRNWSRGHDEELVRPDGTPEKDAAAIRLRAAVDEDGFRIDIGDDEFTDLLRRVGARRLIAAIPHDVRLEDLDADGYHAQLSGRSPAATLVDRLMVVGLDEATAWAICARVRPHLFPSPDRVVGTLLGLRADEDSRPYWWWSLRTDGELRATLASLRAGSQLDARRSESLTTLRLAEILVLQRESDRRLAIGSAATLFPFDEMIAQGQTDA
jgi:hypothetical protein